MNISVPDELKQRMQPLENTMNWSRIAADAFRQAVENAEYLASIRSSVKRRLMQTEVEDMGGIEKTAHRDGQQWAANDARMIELRRLEQHVDKGGLEFPNWEALVRVILGEDFEENRGDWLGHRSQFGSGLVDSYQEPYANSFADGALEMLEEIDRME